MPEPRTEGVAEPKSNGLGGYTCKQVHHLGNIIMIKVTKQESLCQEPGGKGRPIQMDRMKVCRFIHRTGAREEEDVLNNPHICSTGRVMGLPKSEVRVLFMVKLAVQTWAGCF